MFSVFLLLAVLEARLHACQAHGCTFYGLDQSDSAVLAQAMHFRQVPVGKPIVERGSHILAATLVVEGA
eukprot:1190575-Prorocentrum_minimum.AAC.1